MSKMDGIGGALPAGPGPGQHLDFTVRDLVSFGRVPYQNWHGGNTEEDDRVVDWAMEVSDRIVVIKDGKSMRKGHRKKLSRPG